MIKTAKVKRVARNMAKQAALQTYKAICNASPDNIKAIAKLAAQETFKSIVHFAELDPSGQPVTPPLDPKLQPITPPQFPTPQPMDQNSADDDEEDEDESDADDKDNKDDEDEEFYS